MSIGRGVDVPSALPGGPAAFVGREGELAALSARWRSTTSGHRQAVFVVGEPGVGKSRLVHEATASMARDGAVVLVGRCLDLSRPTPYYPIVDALSAAGIS
jgi:predicted ATPase